MKRATRRAFNLLKQASAKSLEEIDTVVNLDRAKAIAPTRLTRTVQQTLTDKHYRWMYRLVVGLLGLAVVSALGLAGWLLVTGQATSYLMAVALIAALVSALVGLLMPTPR